MIRAQINRGAVLPLDHVQESAHSTPKIGHINVGRLGHSRIMPGHRRRRRAVTLGKGTYERRSEEVPLRVDAVEAERRKVYLKRSGLLLHEADDFGEAKSPALLEGVL